MLESIERQRKAVEQSARNGLEAGQEKDIPNLVPGIYAENLTTSGIDLGALDLGDELRVGETVRLRVSKIGKVFGF